MKKRFQLLFGVLLFFFFSLLIGANADSCSGAPCINGGTCNVTGNSTYNCTCPPGINGTNCQNNYSGCLTNPCQYGGTCTVSNNTYSCSCYAGLTGANCQTDNDVCTAVPCTAGSTNPPCYLANFTAICNCTSGVGGNCGTNCSVNPCFNGGTCNTYQGSTTARYCTCPNGYWGPYCAYLYEEMRDFLIHNLGTTYDGVNHLIPTGGRDSMCNPLPNSGWKPQCDSYGRISTTNYGGFLGDLNSKVPFIASNMGHMTSCQLYFEIPTYNLAQTLQSFSSLTSNLTDMELHDLNDSSGSLVLMPPQLSALKNVTKLSFYQLSTFGPIPYGIMQSANISSVSVASSYLCGSIPSYMTAKFSSMSSALFANALLSCPPANYSMVPTNDYAAYLAGCAPCNTNITCLLGSVCVVTSRNTASDNINTQYSGNATCVPDCSAATPCYNGGVLNYNTTTGLPYCICPNTTSGVACQQSGVCINNQNPCVNNGTCPFGACLCPTGFNGTYCQNDYSKCLNYPCSAGQMCIPGNGTYNCTACYPGFNGTHCQNDYSHCFSNPCVNGGNCTAGNYTFTCSCASGFSGNTCKDTINDCFIGSPCLNGGTCVQQATLYNCSCPTGFNGTKCENNFHSCASSPCAYKSSCTPTNGSYYCTCSQGLTGANCLTDNESLFVASCTAGVPPCYLAGSMLVSSCAAGPSGNCATNCLPNPCQNGGSCFSYLGSTTQHYCNCTAGWFGPYCAYAYEEQRDFHVYVQGLVAIGWTITGFLNGRTDLCGQRSDVSDFYCSGPRISEVIIYSSLTTSVSLSETVPLIMSNMNMLANFGISNVKFNYINTELNSVLTPSNFGLVIFETCQFNSTIPSQFASYSNAFNVALDDNQLYGPIPTFLNSFTQLQYLKLGNNKLFGTIPAQTLTYFLTSPNMQTLTLYPNQLSCPIPNYSVVPTNDYSSWGNYCSPCVNHTCNSFEVCVPVSGNATCLSDCSSAHPCQNGGTCVFLPPNYLPSCQCTPYFNGTLCQNATNVPCPSYYSGVNCLNSTCTNNTQCLPNGRCYPTSVNTFACNCTSQYNGTYCQNNYTFCDSSPCLNGGTCVPGNFSFSCICPGTTNGTICQNNNNACASSPCLHGGLCSNTGSNTFSCNCTGTDFNGTTCNNPLEGCSGNLCSQSTSVCINGPSLTYSCNCTVPGYLGPYCNCSTSNQCVNPCSYVTCPANKFCQMTGQFTYNCTSNCTSSSCLNGGTCSGGVCACTSNFGGSFCEYRNRCLGGQVAEPYSCNNGGVCNYAGISANAFEFSCVNCTNGYMGPTCSNLHTSAVQIMDISDRYIYNGGFGFNRALDVCSQSNSFGISCTGSHVTSFILTGQVLYIASYASAGSLNLAGITALTAIQISVASPYVPNCNYFGFDYATGTNSSLTSFSVLGISCIVFSFPLALSNFTGLQTVDLESVTGGSFPVNFTLPSLVSFTISCSGSSSFSGAVPPTLFSGSGQIQTLSFQACPNLSGSIPATPSYPSLKNLIIASGTIGGTLPTQLGMSGGLMLNFQLTSPNSVWTGSFPTEFGQWTNLTSFKLYCHGSSLSGAVDPAVFGSATLSVVDMTSCPNVGGSFPSSPTSIPSQLTYLNIQTSNFAGTIPPWIGNLTSLTSLLLVSNRLVGTIPSELSYIIPNLQISFLIGNFLTGTIPQSFITSVQTSDQQHYLDTRIAGNNLFCPVNSYTFFQETSASAYSSECSGCSSVTCPEAGMMCTSRFPNYCAVNVYTPGVCKNGGNYSYDGQGIAFCNCPTGYAGNLCDIDLTHCNSSPCANGGTCTPLNGTYNCTCPPNVNGTICQNNYTSCNGHSYNTICNYNGYCYPTNNSYVCKCFAEYNGTNCQLDYTGCNTIPCNRFATCVPVSNGTYVCLCPPNLTGVNCQLAVTGTQTPTPTPTTTQNATNMTTTIASQTSQTTTTTTSNVTITPTQTTTTTTSTSYYSSQTPTATPTPANVWVTLCTFGCSPISTTVVIGTTVIWINNDRSTIHFIVSTTPGVFSSGNIPPRGIFSFFFGTVGTYSYNDVYNTSIIGTVYVVSSFATSAVQTQTTTTSKTLTTASTATVTASASPSPTTTATNGFNSSYTTQIYGLICLDRLDYIAVTKTGDLTTAFKLAVRAAISLISGVPLANVTITALTPGSVFVNFYVYGDGQSLHNLNLIITPGSQEQALFLVDLNNLLPSVLVQNGIAVDTARSGVSETLIPTPTVTAAPTTPLVLDPWNTAVISLAGVIGVLFYGGIVLILVFKYCAKNEN